MKEIFGWFVGSILGIVTLVLLGGALSFTSFKLYEYFAPKYTAVDNKVFQESQQYNEGMVRDLENLKLQYLTANKDQKDALRALVLHRFSIYPKEKLSPELRSFYDSLYTGGK